MAHLEKLQHFDIIIAKTQCSGKGRNGRQWESPEGGLYLSIVIKDRRMNHHLLNNIPQAISLSLYHMLSDSQLKNLWIKWPNDIFVGEKKIAGILSESALKGQVIQGISLGVGVNINIEKNKLKTVLQPYTSMSLEKDKTFDLQTSLKVFLSYFREYYENIFTEEGKKILLQQWTEATGLIGKTVSLEKGNDAKIIGTVVAFSEDSSIQLRTEFGIQTFYYGDLSCRLIHS